MDSPSTSLPALPRTYSVFDLLPFVRTTNLGALEAADFPSTYAPALSHTHSAFDLPPTFQTSNLDVLPSAYECARKEV